MGLLERPQAYDVGAHCYMDRISCQYKPFLTLCVWGESWAVAVQAFEGQQLELGTRWGAVAELV